MKLLYLDKVDEKLIMIFYF